ncbi:hypothetical protein [Azospirillum sp. B510]|nr:hypothetical protein [Azospirillum sp. B510]
MSNPLEFVTVSAGAVVEQSAATGDMSTNMRSASAVSETKNAARVLAR